MSKPLHIPVMLAEVLKGLAVAPNGAYLDATFGRGGHSRAILERLGADARLWVMDRDADAIDVAHALAKNDARVSVLHAAFGHDALANLPALDGALMDLGVSSPQLDDGDRGFSFKQDAPLDMRMDRSTGMPAHEWLLRASQQEIAYVLSAYGQDPHAERIAEKICSVRLTQPIRTTNQLADLVIATVPTWTRKHHPATLCFQAIRMQVNDEHGQLFSGIERIATGLKKGGRLAVLSYHSLENEWTSQAVKKVNALCVEKGIVQGTTRMLRRVGGALRPSQSERVENPRSRSAMLRIWEKLC